jgi:SAM-dependent methyltransferase
VTSLEQLVGERTVPRLATENYWFRRHEVAYRALAPRLLAPFPSFAPPVVLEAGSGEGYGVQLLAEAGASRTIALDYDGLALAHSALTYPAVAGRAVRGNLVGFPLAGGSVDVITAFQVIEHLWSPSEFLAECARVLVPGGVLAISTPNRPTFSPGLGRQQKPANPFHFREFDAAELFEMVDDELLVTERLAVGPGPRLKQWQRQHGDLVAAQLSRPASEWPDPLVQFVDSITAGDFVLSGDLQGADVLDLVVLARRR